MFEITEQIMALIIGVAGGCCAIIFYVCHTEDLSFS